MGHFLSILFFTLITCFAIFCYSGLQQSDIDLDERITALEETVGDDFVNGISKLAASLLIL